MFILGFECLHPEYSPLNETIFEIQHDTETLGPDEYFLPVAIVSLLLMVEPTVTAKNSGVAKKQKDVLREYSVMISAQKPDQLGAIKIRRSYYSLLSSTGLNCSMVTILRLHPSET